MINVRPETKSIYKHGFSIYDLQNDGCVCRTYVAKCEKSTVEKEHDAKQHEEPSKRREGNANLCRESVA